MVKWEVREYLTSQGKSPFRDCLESLDIPVAARIQARIYRFELGNLGDVKSVGHGIYEARFDLGPGYRVYFGKDAGKLIILLCGGSKSTQGQDISRARKNWLDYLERKYESKKSRLE